MAFVQQGDSPDNSISAERVTSLFLFSTSLGFFHPPQLARVLRCLVLGWSSCSLDGFVANCVCIRACTFSTHAVWFPSVTCAVCLLHLRLLWFPLPGVHSVPTSTHSGSRLVPLLCRFQGMSKGSCSSVSLCQ